jgi:pyruvate/2-oxoglutarate dehydrogenase complex dihydrolipoamide acyltransferase (E2) component
MKHHEVKIPKVSDAEDAYRILDWYVKIGDTVEAGSSIGEIEAGKAVFELNTEVSGKVEELLADEQSEVTPGQVVAVVGSDE